MTNDRAHRALVIAAILAAFALGVLLGALVPRRRLPRPGVALAPAHAEGSDEERGLDVDSGNTNDSVSGNGTPVAPFGYPVKGNARSGIFHVPGGFAYDRTIASIHFTTREAAEAAGYRASKS